MLPQVVEARQAAAEKDAEATVPLRFPLSLHVRIVFRPVVSRHALTWSERMVECSDGPSLGSTISGWAAGLLA